MKPMCPNTWRHSILTTVFVVLQICSVCSQNITNSTNTTSPTTAAPTYAPTHAPSVGAVVVAPTSTTFAMSIERTAGIYYFWGNSGYYTYMSLFYLCIGTGPVAFIIYLFLRSYRKDTLMSHVKIRARHLFFFFIGWPLWLFAILTNAFAPEDLIAHVVEELIFTFGILIPIATFILLLSPMGSDLRKLADSQKFICVDCSAVVGFAELHGVELKASFDRRDGTITGTLPVPEMRQALGPVAPAKDFVAIGTDKAAVKESLYAQAAQHWKDLDGFAQYKSDMLKGSMGLTSVGTFTGVVTERTRGDTKTECSHEVALAIKQRLAVKTANFDDSYCVPMKVRTDCTFTLQKGSSDLQRAVVSGAVTIPMTYHRVGDPGSAVFSCASLKDALPYLLNGYEAVNHR